MTTNFMNTIKVTTDDKYHNGFLSQELPRLQ